MTQVETVQDIYEAFGRGDVDRILTHMADDVQWDQEAPSYGIPFHEPGSGLDHVRRFFDALQAVEILRFEPTNVLSGGRQVAVPILIEAKVKATGRVARALEIHLWTFDEHGKVSRFFHCLDRHAFVLAFLG